MWMKFLGKSFDFIGDVNLKDKVFGEAKVFQKRFMLGNPIFFRLIVISAMNL